MSGLHNKVLMMAILMGSVMVTPVFAADDSKPATSAPAPAPADAKTSEAAPEKAKDDNAVTRLDAATTAMTKDLDKNQLLQFRAIETSYRTIRAVEDVQLSVSTAVDACGKKNPDMKAAMDKRLVDWKDALRPVVKSGRERLDKMVLLQGFSRPSVVRNYLKMFDEAILYRNQGIKSVPVTEKEQCQKLTDNMDKTQENLINLLTSTLGLDKEIVTTKD